MSPRKNNDNTFNIGEILDEIESNIWEPAGIVEWRYFKMLANYFKAKDMISEETYHVLRAIGRIGMVTVSNSIDDESERTAYEVEHSNKRIDHKDLEELPELLFTYLSKDDKLNSHIGEAICFDHFCQLCKRYNVEAYYDDLQDVSKQFLTIGSIVWGINENNYFTGDGMDSLYYQDLNSVGFIFGYEEMPKHIIYKGRGGKIFITSSGHVFCSFIFERNKKCLHIDTRKKTMENFYNAAPIGIIDDTYLVYFDDESGMVSYYDTRTEQYHDICPQEYGRYRANGSYVLVIPRLAEPYKLYLTGQKEECSKEQKKDILLDKIFNFTTKCGVDYDSVISFLRIQEMISYKISINCLFEIMRYIEKNDQFFGPDDKKRIDTLKDILALLETAGVPRDLDIFEEMWTLCKYHYLCIYDYKKSQPFTSIFYKILYKHSKDVGFIERLRNDPEKLFENDIQYAKRKAASKKEESW